MTAVANFADDFDETPGDEGPHRMLPLEDRLWRHPSEIHKTDQNHLDPLAVRRRWLQTQPTRASAWTAGLVGALLATGLVVLGTHLAGALTGDGTPSPALSSASVTADPPSVVITPAVAGFGHSVAAAVARVSTEMARVNLISGTSHITELALIVNRAGYLVVPEGDAESASSILVTLENGVQYVGQEVGVDEYLGIALIHINGADNLTETKFSTGTESVKGALAVAITSTHATTAISTLHLIKSNAGSATSPQQEELVSDLPVASTPLGTVLLNGLGHVSGLIVQKQGDTLVVASGVRLAAGVNTLLASQRLTAKSLGVRYVTSKSDANTPQGARIQAVEGGSISEVSGLRVGDVIVGINGLTISSKQMLDQDLRNLTPTAPVVLTVSTSLTSHTIVLPPTVSAG